MQRIFGKDEFIFSLFLEKMQPERDNILDNSFEEDDEVSQDLAQT